MLNVGQISPSLEHLIVEDEKLGARSKFGKVLAFMLDWRQPWIQTEAGLESRNISSQNVFVD